VKMWRCGDVEISCPQITRINTDVGALHATPYENYTDFCARAKRSV
jgi:hypothetical protein